MARHTPAPCLGLNDRCCSIQLLTGVTALPFTPKAGATLLPRLPLVLVLLTPVLLQLSPLMLLPPALLSLLSLRKPGMPAGSIRHAQVRWLLLLGLLTRHGAALAAPLALRRLYRKPRTRCIAFVVVLHRIKPSVDRNDWASFFLDFREPANIDTSTSSYVSKPVRSTLLTSVQLILPRRTVLEKQCHGSTLAAEA